MKINVLFYSTYGHNYRTALEVKKALESKEAPEGTEVGVYRIPETLSPEIVAALGATEAQKAFADVPAATWDSLSEADGLIFVFPTRYGNMPAQVKAFLDSTGQLWAKGALIGKPVSVMVSSAMQHGGQESTILSSVPVFLHHGMVFVGLPVTFPGLGVMDEISGGSFYGASTVVGGQGERSHSENELAGIRFQAVHLAKIAKKLAAK